MRIQKFILYISVLFVVSAGSAYAQSGCLKTPAEYGFAESVAPLLSGIEYGQNSPFNGMCPFLENGALAGSDDKRAHTGCAATAVASVLKFFASTKGNNVQPLNPGTSETWTYTSTDNVNPKNTQTIINNISEHTYDWSLIRGSYSGTLGTDYTQEEADAIAQLMVDCGYALRMNYTQVTSDAGHEIIPNALFKYYGFNGQTMQTYYRNTTSQELWEKTIYGELAAGRPVLIKGFLSGGGGGHEYVVDGYDAEGYLHVNFGNADGGKFVPVYEHENYVANFSIITGIEYYNKVTNSYNPSSNVHRLNDMSYENGQVSFQLRNDGLGETEVSISGTSSGSNVKTSLAVIRDGVVIGYCGVQNQDVSLATMSDEKYSFDLTLTSGALSVSNLSSTTLSPLEVKMSGISNDGTGIQEGDILVPIISTDGYGRMWEIADGNEIKVNSIKVKSATLPDGFYRIYQNGKALTAENGSTSLTLTDYDENNDFQIFYLTTTSKGTTLMDFMGEKYCYKSSNITVDLLTTGYEETVSYQGTYRAYYSILEAGERQYTISMNDYYIVDSDGSVIYGKVGSTSTNQFWTIEPATPSHSAVTYTVNFKNCPIAVGTNRYIEYNDNQCTEDSLTINNNQLTADQISAPGKTGYLSCIVVNNDKYTITIYYAQDANGDKAITIADAAKLVKSANSLTGGQAQIDDLNEVIDFILKK